MNASVTWPCCLSVAERTLTPSNSWQVVRTKATRAKLGSRCGRPDGGGSYPTLRPRVSGTPGRSRLVVVDAVEQERPWLPGRARREIVGAPGDAPRIRHP